MSQYLSELFQKLWRDYERVTPQASNVAALLKRRGDVIINDHIALRTFDDERVGLHVLDRAFVEGGYEPIEDYEFPEKKLVATHYEHPNKRMPKVFISALELGRCSSELQATVRGLLDHLPPGSSAQWDFPASGRRWPIDYSTYQALEAESDYAAWLAAFGFRANHFTVAAHSLTSVSSLEELNGLLKDGGVELSSIGGEIKGSPSQGLQQSSTLADTALVDFADGQHAVPCCYYEFALRHPMEDGSLFQGFIPGSATHLFESTAR